MNSTNKDNCTTKTIFCKLSCSNSKNGFFSLYFIFFLALLSTFIFCFGFVFYASQSKNLFQKICVTTAVEIQKNIVHTEQKLFFLNSESTALRLRMNLLKTALITTPPPEDLVLIAEIEALQFQQQALDNLQKNIITTANQISRTAYFSAVESSNQLILDLASFWGSYLRLFTIIKPSFPPTLAVRADSVGGLAPNYEFDYASRARQSVVLHWQNNFTAFENITKLSREIQYGMTCTIAAERQSSTWKIKIRLDRF